MTSHFDSPSHSLRRGTCPQISQSFLLGDDLTRSSEGNAVFLLGCRRASLLPLRRRERTRAPCRATTSLSRLSCLPKPWPLACENLLLRRLTPVEVVWHRGDPPAHYTPRPISCTAPARRDCPQLSHYLDWPRQEFPSTAARLGVGAKICLPRAHGICRPDLDDLSL